MAAVNCLYVAAASTAASAAALQWWASSLLDGDAGAGEDGAWLGAVLRSKVTVALLANLAVHVFLVIILALKPLTTTIVIFGRVLVTMSCLSPMLISKEISGAIEAFRYQSLVCNSIFCSANFYRDQKSVGAHH
ncbi:hypothetical protein Zm00014a_032675 [Zea mays]|uniref:Uncharacterized protein n=1 Tax=Zea mays TaxID=4577 RepID=A0A3L6FZG2_MAIZE|nr:hypothetical protein Zm00014a_032675 [Zea mays]